MSIKYYNGYDEVVRTTPKNHHTTWNTDEKYYKQNDGDAVVNPEWTEAGELVSAKVTKTNAVLARTQEIIASGFVYGPYTFSADSEAQMNWTSILIVLDSLSYPFNIGDVNGNPISFVNKEAIQSAYGSGLVRKSYIMEGEFTLRGEINNCTTLSQLSGIVDSRV